MDLFDPSSIMTVFTIRSSRRNYFERVDEIVDIIHELEGKCHDPQTKTLIWKHIIEKCLEHEMPEHYRVAFEKLTESYRSP